MEGADPLPHLLVRRVGVNGRRERTRMPREPLRQEEVPAGTVNVGHGGMPHRMEGVQPVESCLDLPGSNAHAATV
jgi:hypothetical protein